MSSPPYDGSGLRLGGMKRSTGLLERVSRETGGELVESSSPSYFLLVESLDRSAIVL